MSTEGGGTSSRSLILFWSRVVIIVLGSASAWVGGITRCVLTSLQVEMQLIRACHDLQFFIIFCGWSTLFTAYIAVVLAVKMGTEGSLDGQMLALVIM